MKERLQTVLSHAGVASRRRAAELIETGKVKVDGRVVREKGLGVDPIEQEILVDGRPVPKECRKYYFLFNKPKGVITTVTDTHGRKKVSDYFRGVGARLYPVGRLDKDTTGLLIITNDGDLAHRLSHPSFEVEKEYEAAVKGRLRPRDISILEKGVELDDGRTSPCRIKVLKRSDGGMRISIRLHEGRKRQVRRMFDHVGAEVAELCRVRYAGLAIGKLKEGQFRSLSAKEVEELKAGSR